MIHAEVYLSLGSTNITTNNTKILITDIGDDTEGDLPSLTCHTNLTACCRSKNENNGSGGLGQWTYPNGTVILNKGKAMAAGQQFFIVRNAAQLIRLARREGNNPLNPTGAYCCTVPGNMTFCANLGEWFCSIHYWDSIHNPLPVVCPSLLLINGNVSYTDSTLGLDTVATYTCDTGYTLMGDNTTTCGMDGNWSASATNCQCGCD